MAAVSVCGRRPVTAPLVAITGRRLPGSALPMLEGRYQEHAFDMFFSAFPAAIADAGGLPVELPYEAAHAGIVARVDALVVTGGQDVAPSRWGGDEGCARGPIDPARDEYELGLLEAALDRGLPILGVCRGMQLLNVALGGTLVPDLPDEPIDHTSGNAPTATRSHPVMTATGSLARALFGNEIGVNSLHHQAVAEVGRGVSITGRAPDGTAEVIEMPGRPVLGVQWHPEWHDVPDGSFRWLVNAATDFKHGCYEAS